MMVFSYENTHDMDEGGPKKLEFNRKRIGAEPTPPIQQQNSAGHDNFAAPTTTQYGDA